jgi:hypothetical protein
MTFLCRITVKLQEKILPSLAVYRIVSSRCSQFRAELVKCCACLIPIRILAVYLFESVTEKLQSRRLAEVMFMLASLRLADPAKRIRMQEACE